MPKERIRKSGKDGWADLLVQWGSEELGPAEKYQQWDERPRVRLFIIADEMGIPGGFMFHPDMDRLRQLDPERAKNWEGADAVGPVDIMLDRQQINRLIRVLKRARDNAYGRDE